MQFNTPTTKQEMYDTLQEIFNYYRKGNLVYDGVTLQPLELERLDFSKRSDADLYEIAHKSLVAEHMKESNEYKGKINQKISELQSQINALEQSKQALIQKTIDTYEQSQLKANKEAIKNGLTGSSIIVDKWAQLEGQKNDKITEIESEYATKLASLNASLNWYITQGEEADVYLEDKHAYEINAKIQQLGQEQEKIYREVFKYNNTLDEKEQRYENTIKQTNASLQLRFLEIHSVEYSKDQLIEMGYYADAIDCVCAYYNTLPIRDAVTTILSDTRIMVYLDDYYTTLTNMYKSRLDVDYTS